MFARFDTSSPADRRRFTLPLLFGAGLLLLWVLVQFSPRSAPESSVRSDEAGTVASSPNVPKGEAAAAPSFFSWGNAAALLLLTAGGAFALRLRRQNPGRRSEDALLSTVGELPLSQNQQLRLVACGDDVLLLGITSERITLLKRYPHTDFPDKDALPDADASALPFANVLRQHLQGTA